MKASELRALDAGALSAKEEEFKKELFNLKMQCATGQAENPSRVQILRRNIARLKTIVKEQEKGA